MWLHLSQALPKGISALKSLKVLDLEGNKLEYLATEISMFEHVLPGAICIYSCLQGYLRELTKLNVQSNRITSLPRGLG